MVVRNITLTYISSQDSIFPKIAKATKNNKKNPNYMNFFFEVDSKLAFKIFDGNSNKKRLEYL